MAESLLRERLLVVASALFVAGCSGEETTAVARWELASSGEVILPAEIRDRVPKRGETITLRTSVPVPPAMRGAPLSLAIPTHWCSPRLTVEGEPIDDVARSPFENERSRGAHLYRIPARLTDRASLAMRLDVADTYALCTTFMSVPVLALGDHGPRAYRVATWFNDVAPIVTIGTAFVLALAFVVFGRTTARGRGYRWASLAAIASISGAAGLLGVWQFFIGWRGDLIAGLGALLAQYAGVRFGLAYFGDPRPTKWWTAAAIGLALVEIAVTARYDLRPLFGMVFAITLLMFVTSTVFLARRRAQSNARTLLVALQG